jgi:hypothetical protein
MSTVAENARKDFEAYVASTLGLPTAMISAHWNGERYNDTSDLEPYWRCWTAAQQAILRYFSEPIAWAIFSDRHIDDQTTDMELAVYWRAYWQEIGHDMTARRRPFTAEEATARRKAEIGELIKVLNPFVGACLTLSQCAEALYDAGYRKLIDMSNADLEQQS